MKIAVCQINPIVGDVRHNTQLICSFIERAKGEGADLVVFPELAVLGYPPRDLLYRPETFGLVEQVLNEEIQTRSQGIGVILGAPVKDSFNRSLYNSALFYRCGSLMGRQDKTLLPTYDVFDERRYFSAARERGIFHFKSFKIGCSICEDIWNDKDYWGELRYEFDPVYEQAVEKGADIIINIAASPYNFGKRSLRADMLGAAARKYGRAIVFVNQVGGNDELVFDGSSLVLDSTGRIVWQGRSFEEDFTVIEFPNKSMSSFQVKEGIECIYDALVLGVRDYIRKVGLSKAVIGISGGIDSAVVAAVAVDALGSENVLGVFMPSRYSSAQSLADSRCLARNLGILLREISIEAVFDTFLKQLNNGKLLQDVAEENLQARIRGNILMFISNKEGHLVLSTGNKSEMAVGYTTLYGDMSGGLSVLGDVFKTTVYELAHYINRRKEVIPQSIISKAPSAELRPNQKDEDSLPPYAVLDSILKAYIEENMSLEKIVAQGFDEYLVKDVINKVDRSEYKRKQAPITLRVSAKAFGSGRRFPIAWRRP